MAYVQFAGFMSNLTATYSDIDTDLPVFGEHIAVLKSRMADGDNTYLKITDGTYIEFIKVSNVGGNLLVDRGAENTTPRTFPKGSCVSWAITASAVREIVCQMPCCPDTMEQDTPEELPPPIIDVGGTVQK